MVGREEYHLTNAIAFFCLIEPCGLYIRLGRCGAKRRKIIGINQNSVLIWHLARARAERAPVFGHLRAALPIASHHGVGAQEGIEAQFGHGAKVVPRGIVCSCTTLGLLAFAAQHNHNREDEDA